MDCPKCGGEHSADDCDEFSVKDECELLYDRDDDTYCHDGHMEYEGCPEPCHHFIEREDMRRSE